jgi:Kef-type K+ transport system membrane component KefB
MLETNNVFSEIALLMASACVFGGLALWLRQPITLAFIIVGIVIGPAGFAIITASEQVELFAELGIALLLFVVGLKLDPKEIREVGFVVIVTTLGQLFLTGVFGFIMAFWLGNDLISCFYIGICLNFSSTVIIVKLLSDKKEIDALHSRIAVGVLIIQDIVVILVMIVLTAFVNDSHQDNLLLMLATVLIKGSSFLLIIALFTNYLLPKILNSFAQSVELLIIFAVAWAFCLASISAQLGFGQEVGAFLAGVSLAATDYRMIIGIRLVSLRDFLLLFFFINLGIHIDIEHIRQAILPALALSSFVLIGKPLIILTIIGRMGYSKYTATMTSLFLSQISEFSLILVTLGVSLGHIEADVMGLITLVGLITMGVSTYMIIYCHQIYRYLSPYLEIFQRKIKHPEEILGSLEQNSLTYIDVILFGLGRYGGSIMKYLQQEGLVVVGVDFNPEIVKFWHQQDVLTLYGDAENPECAATLPLAKTKWVVSSIPGEDLSLNLLHVLKEHRFQGKIALTSHSTQEMAVLHQAGADLVLLPFRDAAKQAAEMLFISAEHGFSWHENDP